MNKFFVMLERRLFKKLKILVSGREYIKFESSFWIYYGILSKGV